MSVEYTDQNSVHMLDNERMYGIRKLPHLKQSFEKQRVGYVTEKDKEELLKVRNFLYGHMNI